MHNDSSRAKYLFCGEKDRVCARAMGIPISGTPAGDSEIPLAIPVHSDIGIIGFPMDSEIASRMKLEKETRRVLVIGVLKNSIAEKAGIRAGTTPAVFRGTNGMLGGDVIVSVEDKSVDNIEDLKDYISHYHISGKQIKFTVLRNGKPIDIDLVY